MRLSRNLLTAVALIFCCNITSADTLREIYELALENDAQLKAQEAQYRANLETENLGRAALLPQVRGNYDYTESDTDTDAKSIDVGEDGSFPKGRQLPCAPDSKEKERSTSPCSSKRKRTTSVSFQRATASIWQ